MSSASFKFHNLKSVIELYFSGVRIVRRWTNCKIHIDFPRGENYNNENIIFYNQLNMKSKVFAWKGGDMSVTIRDILEKNLLEELKPIAGTSSLDNLFTWVNIMEILDTPDNIKKDELLITTGYDLADFEKHRGLISRLKSRSVSGMIIQTGYYLERIPGYLIQAADAYDFPLLELPPNYTFSDILHILMDELNQYREISSKTYLNSEYFYTSIQNKLCNAANLFQTDNANCYLFAFSPVLPISASFGKYHNALERFISFLASLSDDCVYDIADNGESVIYLVLQEKHNLSAVTYDIQIQLTFLSEQDGVHLFAGADQVPSTAYLRSSLKNAVSCITLLDSIKAKRGICAYNYYTFIKMFGYMYKNNPFFALKNQALQILLDKDRTGNFNYVHTLRIYLSENCNATHASERLFIHRHTLINRIQTITELCNCDLDDYYTRLYLSMSLLIHDYFAV